MSKKKLKKLKDIEPQFVIKPQTTLERIVAAAVRSTFRPKWTRTLAPDVRRQGIYTAYHDALALVSTEMLSRNLSKIEIQKLANQIAGQERKYLLRDESIFHESDENPPADDYKGDEPNEPLKPWDQKNVSRPFIARGHYFDVDENGERIDRKNPEQATQRSLVGLTVPRVAEAQEVGGTTGLQPDWKALTNFKIDLQRHVEDLHQEIDADHFWHPQHLRLKCIYHNLISDEFLKLLQSVSDDDIMFFLHYYDSDPDKPAHTPTERKRFERLKLPMTWIICWYDCASDYFNTIEAIKKRVLWEAERRNRQN